MPNNSYHKLDAYKYWLNTLMSSLLNIDRLVLKNYVAFTGVAIK